MTYSYQKEVKIGDERIRRLVSWYMGGKAGPVQIDAELHKRCNLLCPPCSRQASDFDTNSHSRKNELPLHKWLSAVREAKGLGVLIWNIEGGGEPFANKELTIPVIKEIKKQGLYGIVTTNGTLLTEEDIRLLVEIGWDRIHFSLDGHNAELNDMIRGKGNYEKTTNAIRLLCKWKKHYGSESPMLNINTVINNRNYKYLPELVELAHGFSTDFIFTEPLIVYHKSGEHLKLGQKELDELDIYITRAKGLADKYLIDNNFATKDKNLDKNLVEKTSMMQEVLVNEAKEEEHPFLSVPCFKPWDNMAIKFNGLAGHCGLIEEGGNIKDMALSEIWFGRDMQLIRENMLKKKLLSHCSKCCASDITQRRRFRKALLELVKNG